MPLYIDGTLMPEPAHSGISFSNAKVWSSNTGRSLSAKMNGTIVSVKGTLSISWAVLTRTEYNKIASVVNSKTEWHSVVLTDTSGNTLWSKTVYFGDLTCSLYSVSSSLRHYKECSVNAIER